MGEIVEGIEIPDAADEVPDPAEVRNRRKPTSKKKPAAKPGKVRGKKVSDHKTRS